MAQPKNTITAELVKEWELELKGGNYYLKGKKIPDLPKVINDPYIEKNRGFWTASKLKFLEEDPFMCFCKYILELDFGDSKEENHFIIGNAVDYFVSYGEEDFLEKYYIPNGEDMFKPDPQIYSEIDLKNQEIVINGIRSEGMKKKAIKDFKFIEKNLGRIKKDSDVIFNEQHLKKVKFEFNELHTIIEDTRIKYPKRGRATNEKLLEKLRVKKTFIKKYLWKYILSVPDAKEIMQIITEIKRQPLFDLGGDYETQVLIKAEFKGIKILGTLDRENVENNVIRDSKTIAAKSNQHFRKTCNLSIQEYNYDFSMGFYEFLRAVHNIKDGDDLEKSRSEVILDFIGKGTCSRYLPYRIPTEILDEQRKRILKVLFFLEKCIKEKDFPLYTEINTFDDGYLKCKYYEHSPCGIAKEVLNYQPFDLEFPSP